MTREFYILSFFMCIILFWNITSVSIDNDDGLHIRGHLSMSVINYYANIHQIDTDKVILYKHNGLRRIPVNNIFLAGARWSIGARPIVGDHIHSAMSIYINNEPKIDAEHDRSFMQEIKYEPPYYKGSICKVPGDIAYTKLWPHSGVHTHCDGLIHVHPWSAPYVLRKEGLDIRLQMWFDQVGIYYREYPFVSLEFPDGKRYDGNATHRWYLSERKCFKSNNRDILYESHLNQVWLGNAYASYVLWFDMIDSEEPPAIDSHLNRLQEVGAYGYDGSPYPQPCLHK